MIKVSSITYVKNGEKYIERCIRSIMNQTLKDIEIIVIDGGSTDLTCDIVKNLAKEDNRIIMVKCEGSVGAQFNCGLKLASGEYIGICEGDDYILESKYEKLYNIARKDRCDIVKASYLQFVELDNKEYGWEIKSCPEDRFECVVSADKSPGYFLRFGINGFWSGIYSKKFLKKYLIQMNETKGAAYQDITFSFLTQLYAEQCYFVREPLHCYRLDNEQASVYSDKCIEMHCREYGLLEKILKKRNIWDNYKSLFLSWEFASYRHFCCIVSQEIRSKKIDIIYEILSRQIQENDIFMTENYLDTIDVYEAIKCGREAFGKAILKNIQREARMLNYFKEQFSKEKKVAIFGAGHIGEIICTYAMIHGKEILMIDNSVEAREAGCCGQKVYPPDIIKKNKNLTYLVANYKYGKEIKDQLMKLGVDENNIVLCQNEDYFLRRVFAGVKIDEL